MNFESLLAELPARRGAVLTLERGKPIRTPFADLAVAVEKAKNRLSAAGVGPGMRVGIYAPNSVHWLVYDLALIALKAISVPFTEDFAGKIDQALLDRYHIALLLLASDQAHQFAERPAHVALLDRDEGPIAVRAASAPDEDSADYHTMVFSSGSAGGLKGLVISRTGLEATLPPIVEAVGVTSRDCLLLFLPMSNFQQRSMCYAALLHDFDIIITDYLQLFAAIKVFHPTVLIAPPIFYQMVHTRFANMPAWKKSLWTMTGNAISLLPGASLRRGLARRLFRDFHRQFGDRMRLLLTGMAPVKRSATEFFERMQLPLSETYGMVEAGSLTFRAAGERGKIDSVGKPLRGVVLELAEDGEVIVRRKQFLTLKYFQAAEGENERTFVAPDRIATGDIGRLDEDGYLYLMGRKKELIITPGGYKVHPEVIEHEMSACPDISQCVIFPKAGASQLVAVIVPATPDEQARARIRRFAATLSVARKGMPIGEVIFADEPFSTDNGMLRPNLKVDRRNIAARFNLSG